MSEPDYVYFLEQGEFCFIKNSGEVQEKGLARSRKGRGKKALLKSMEKKQESPNKSKNKKVKKYQIGIVEGGLGQTIGL